MTFRCTSSVPETCSNGADYSNSRSAPTSSRAQLSAEKLRALVRLENGTLYWMPRDDIADPQARKFNKYWAGKPVALRRCQDGYHTIRIYERRYFAHRVIWALHHGDWPKNVIDHINRVRTDNRIENLRDVTPRENAANTARKDGTVELVAGTVFRHRNLWRVDFMVGGHRIHAGLYPTRNEAEAARLGANRMLNALPRRPLSRQES